MSPNSGLTPKSMGNGEGGGSAPASIYLGPCESAKLLLDSNFSRAAIVTVCAVAIVQSGALLLAGLF
jgi:hypothetical protein